MARLHHISHPWMPVGILSSASPNSPGGSFLNGTSQADSVFCRSTSLLASLSSSAARPFYPSFNQRIAQQSPSFFHSSTLIYSPSVVGIRKDDGDKLMHDDPDFSPELDAIPADPTTRDLEAPPAVNGRNHKAMGEYVAPYLMNVVSAVPVDLRKLGPHAATSSQVRNEIRSTMKDRMGRILRLFELKGERTLVLGPFGVMEGFQIEDCATAWAELLVCRGVDSQLGDGRFRDVFENVIFAMPRWMMGSFRRAWEMRMFEDSLVRELTDDEEDDDTDMEEVKVF